MNSTGGCRGHMYGYGAFFLNGIMGSITIFGCFPPLYFCEKAYSCRNKDSLVSYFDLSYKVQFSSKILPTTHYINLQMLIRSIKSELMTISQPLPQISRRI
jgi:hypothetical protein